MTEGTFESEGNLLRFFPSQSSGPPELKTLWITNMWPDEVRPYFGNYAYSQCESLWNLGLDVDVLYLRGLLSQTAYLTELPRVRQIINRAPYKVIHAHYGHTGAVAVAARARPLVISFCGEDLLGAPRDNGNTLKSDLERTVFRQLPRFCAATITKSHDMERRIPRPLRQRNHVLPNGVDTAKFRPRPREEARRDLGWDPAERVVMFLGDPEDPRKRIELAQGAMDEVLARTSGVRFEVVSGLDPSEIPTVMNAVDVLVFPSRSEGSPNAIKEAMAAALPIVATPVGDIPERLHGVAGCFVREAEPDQFAEAILEALEAQRSPEARDAVMAISIDAIAHRLRDIYASIAYGDPAASVPTELSAVRATA